MRSKTKIANAIYQTFLMNWKSSVNDRKSLHPLPTRNQLASELTNGLVLHCCRFLLPLLSFSNLLYNEQKVEAIIKDGQSLIFYLHFSPYMHSQIFPVSGRTMPLIQFPTLWGRTRRKRKTTSGKEWRSDKVSNAAVLHVLAFFTVGNASQGCRVM